MSNLLCLSDHRWPCSRADLESANPLTAFPPDLADAQPLDQFGFILPEPTSPPPHDPLTHCVVEVRPTKGDDGIWRQSWEVVELPPPPPPGPDWPQFRQAIRSENGFSAAFVAAFSADPMVAHTLGSRLDWFQTTGDYALFLESLTLTLQALPPQEAAHIAMEFMALASRCGLPAAFLDALQTLFPEPAP